MTAPLLSVRDLRVSFPTRDGGRVNVVDGVSFDLGRERLGIVGESGSGKSVTALSLLRLHAPRTTRISGQVLFEGTDLLSLSDRHYVGARVEEMLGVMGRFGATQDNVRAQHRLVLHPDAAASGWP